MMIPLRPLARVLTQVFWVAGGSIIRATYKAYKETITNTNSPVGSYFKQMSPEEAAKILGFLSHKGLTHSQIVEAHRRLVSINSASKNFTGSPYLVERIDVAKHILASNMKETLNNERISRFK